MRSTFSTLMEIIVPNHKHTNTYIYLSSAYTVRRYAYNAQSQAMPSQAKSIWIENSLSKCFRTFEYSDQMRQKLLQYIAHLFGLLFSYRKTGSIAKCFTSLSDDVIIKKKREEIVEKKNIDCYILACADINSLLFILIFRSDKMRRTKLIYYLLG